MTPFEESCWDERYREATAGSGAGRPNGQLVAEAADLPPGTPANRRPGSAAPTNQRHRPAARRTGEPGPRRVLGWSPTTLCSKYLWEW